MALLDSRALDDLAFPGMAMSVVYPKQKHPIGRAVSVYLILRAQHHTPAVALAGAVGYLLAALPEDWDEGRLELAGRCRAMEREVLQKRRAVVQEPGAVVLDESELEGAPPSW